MAWVKNAAYIEQTSLLTPQFHLHFAPSEPIVVNMLCSFDGKEFIVRAINRGPSGFIVATCEEVPQPCIETAVLTRVGAYDPVAEQFSTSSLNIKVVRLRWQSLYQYGSLIAPKYGPEDIQTVIAKAAATPVAGSRLAMSDGEWQIASVDDGGDVWLCRTVRYV
jgi:hypothetical protein